GVLQRLVEDLVPGRGEGVDAGRHIAARGFRDQVCEQVRLRQRQGRSARSDSYCFQGCHGDIGFPVARDVQAPPKSCKAMMQGAVTLLGIETSCDETAAAVV